jgi:nickel-dependent lactate racemase
VTVVKLPYGEDEIRFEVAQSRIIDTLIPHETPSAENPYQTIREALGSPVDSTRLRNLVRKGKTAVIIADDYTRPTPAGPISQAILDELNSQGIDDSHVAIVIATGLHRQMNEVELKLKLGPDVTRRVEVTCHNPWDDNQNEEIGKTSRGTPIWINKRVLEADLRITIGLITGHFAAGYGAGAKTILPGVSGYRTIFHNHAVLQSAPSARIGVTEGNPGWEDMVEVLQFLGPTLAVNVVLNAKNELVAAFHGSPVAAQKAGMELYRTIYAFKVKERADIVIASANPEHAYLDQCLKTIVPASMFTKDGGVRIVASPCKEHLGPPFLRELYYDSLTPEWPSPEEYERIMRSGKLKDIGDAAGILKLLQSNNSGLILVSDPSFDQDLTNLKIAHRSSVQDALDGVTERFGANSRVLIIPYGPITLPIPLHASE